MDCTELRADIDRLKDELRAFRGCVEKMRNAKAHDEELRDAMMFIDSDLSDRILTKYLKDFQEQNSEMFPDCVLGELVDTKDDIDGWMHIHSAAIVGDNRILVGGERGAFRTGFYDSQGKLVLGKRININDANGNPACINSIVATENGRVLIGGSNGAFYEGSYGESGELTFGERIDVWSNRNWTSINTIAATEGGRVLVGGLNGVLYMGSYNNHEKLELDDRTSVRGGDITAIAVIDEDHVLIGSSGGMVHVGSYNDQGKLILGEPIFISDSRRQPEYICSITTNDDGRVLIGGGDGRLYSGFYKQGRLALGKLVKIEDYYGYSARIKVRSIAATSDGGVLIGGKTACFIWAPMTAKGNLY